MSQKNRSVLSHELVYIYRNDRRNKPTKADKRKSKIAAPTAEELNNELERYMGEEVVVKKLDEELDSYFNAGCEGSETNAV